VPSLEGYNSRILILGGGHAVTPVHQGAVR
jgi:hypothetical protein